jgi:ADP-ribose pyrophosphatase YjhB (NUDIX family)
VLALLDEVRAIAQTGLAYTESPFDRERYERLLHLAATEYAAVEESDTGSVRARLQRELGYVTAKVGVDAAIFDRDDRALLIRRTDDGRWGLVSGWLDPNEAPEDAVARELREEIGVHGHVEHLVGAFARPASAEHGPHGAIALVYLCRIEPGPFRLQPHEVLEAGWFELDTVHDWHKNHRRYAYAAREARWRRSAGL